MTTAVIIYDKLAYEEDANTVHHILRKAGITSIAHIDMREPPVRGDIQVHIRIPIYSAVPWAHTNIVVIHPDQWVPAFNAYLHAFRTYDMKVHPFTKVNDSQSELVKDSPSELVKDVYDHFFPLLHVTSNNILGTPILQIADCPPISIITPTYNRKALIDIAFHNLLSTDYPKEKIEWIIVEDCDGFSKETMATDKIINFQVLCPTISVRYIPLEGRVSIGEKRNIGITHASHSIILFMDDDDHYPITSFRRRVAWLTKGNKDIVCCTTLPLYDLKSATSAVSVPPFHLPLSQRISEATLTFKKSVWESRPFSDVSIAEGESWIDGRESDVLEIAPQQIIVAFSHGANQSSRIVPNNTKQSCFWGFPMEYLQFIHGLAGVSISTS